MDSPPTSRARFLTEDGEPRTRPTEWLPALLEVLVPPLERPQVRVLRNGQELPVRGQVIGGADRVVAMWPRVGAGRHLVTITTPGWRSEFEVAISPAKLSGDAYQSLIEDLESSLPASVTLTLQGAGALAGLVKVPPRANVIEEEFLRLTRVVEGTKDRAGLIDVLNELALDPRPRLSPIHPWVPRRQARRPDAAALAKAYWQPANLDAGQVPIRVFDRRVTHSVDTYENRVVRAVSEEAFLRLRSLRRLLGEPTDDARRRAADACAAMDGALHNARRRATFLRGVGPLAGQPHRVTMVLSRVPPYRAALSALLELHRNVHVELDEPALAAPLENLPRLYEIWGTLKVIAAVLAVAGRAGWSVHEQRLVWSRPGTRLVRLLADDRPALTMRSPQGDTTLRVFPQRGYPRAGALSSLTYRQVPDVAIEIADDRGPRVLIFDPKYKLESEALGAGSTGSDLVADVGEEADPVVQQGDGSAVAMQPARPKKVDIDKMHAYRDSIRDQANRRVVEYAAILYPGPTTRFRDELGAVRAVPGDSEDLETELEEVLATRLAPQGQAR